MTEKFPPSIEAAKLYERVSAKGNTYLAGRLGGLKLVALKTNDVDQEGHAIWQLKVSAAGPRKDQTARSPDVRETSKGFGAISERSDEGYSHIDDVIPF